jgi:uncharacterized repeat protein (TIGR01451 family)
MKLLYRDRPTRKALGCAIAVALAIGHAAAQEPGLAVNLVARKVVVTEKGESFVAAETAKPADVIEYEATYKNRGKSAVSNVAATVPIPAGLTLVPDSSKPTAVEASVDGKNFAPVPLTKDVMNAYGMMEKQAVPLGEYRALRWILPELAAGADAKVALRARVLTSNDKR